jgi:GxxExxY protein
MKGLNMEFDNLSNKIIGLIIEVHKQLGPGLLENTYKQCLAYELMNANIDFEMEVNLPIQYKSVNIACAFRIDMIIENQLILELKNVEKLLPVHEAQILTYMRLSNIKVGLLVNFREKYLRNGIKRYIL